jgi:hypothetical protein
MAEIFKKLDKVVPKKDFGKVVFLDRSAEAEEVDKMAEKRAEAQRFVSMETTVDDYRQLMWELHELYRKNAESHQQIGHSFEAKQKSPEAFTYDPNGSKFEMEARRIEHAQKQAEYEVAQQAIWAGMQAWGKGQKPNEAFFRQLRTSLQDIEKQEREAFEASRRVPADPYLLEQWKQVARKKQILQNFEAHLRGSK